MVYLDNRLLWSDMKAWTTAICNNMYEFPKYAEQQKPDTKLCLLYNFIYMKIQNRQNYFMDLDFTAVASCGRGSRLAMDKKELSGRKGKFYHLENVVD